MKDSKTFSRHKIKKIEIVVSPYFYEMVKEVSKHSGQSIGELLENKSVITFEQYFGIKPNYHKLGHGMFHYQPDELK